MPTHETVLDVRDLQRRLLIVQRQRERSWSTMTTALGHLVPQLIPTLIFVAILYLLSRPR